VAGGFRGRYENQGKPAAEQGGSLLEQLIVG
jgi:hypothetical protein